ncbi:DUF1573 domain-containing protein [Adhaeribacter terreus]|uniref:DUF1573 domain-containing protein n=1 Tax=Adhaeribacter terreus TaxID=529703 RepID=A0ABW0EI50_9BACT
MKTRLIYALLVLFGFFATVSCDKKGENNTATTNHNEATAEDLSASDLINNPNTANPEVVTTGPAPVMSFEKYEHDFGDIKPGDVVKHTFNFKNTGEAPLIIESATASCGCTVPSYPKEPIAPGQSGKIDVQFDSKGKTGQQNKQISIRSNTQPNITELTIKTNILQ